MAKYLRKNITLLPTPEGNAAFLFLDKLGHYQGRFLTQIINQYLASNNINFDKLENLSRKEAQALILCNTIKTSSSSTEAPNIQISANELLKALSGLIVNAQVPIAEEKTTNVEKVEKPAILSETETKSKTTIEYAEDELDELNDLDDFDDEDIDSSMDDFDLSMIEAFRQ